MCVCLFSHDINITYTYVQLATNLNNVVFFFFGIPAIGYYGVNECYIDESK